MSLSYVPKAHKTQDFELNLCCGTFPMLLWVEIFKNDTI